MNKLLKFCSSFVSIALLSALGCSDGDVQRTQDDSATIPSEPDPREACDAGSSKPDAAPGADGSATCGCNVTESVNREPLACLCAAPENAASCPATLDDYDLEALCERGPVLRREGCGRVMLSASGGGYAGSNPVFDAESRALIGVYDYSDVPFGACDAHVYLYGTGLFPVGSRVASAADECATISYCSLCGAEGGYPACD